MAIKLGTVRKRCPEGDMYVFKNGVATVPGVYFQRKPMTITLAEFNAMSVEIENLDVAISVAKEC